MVATASSDHGNPPLPSAQRSHTQPLLPICTNGCNRRGRRPLHLAATAPGRQFGRRREDRCQVDGRHRSRRSWPPRRRPPPRRRLQPPALPPPPPCPLKLLSRRAAGFFGERGRRQVGGVGIDLAERGGGSSRAAAPSARPATSPSLRCPSPSSSSTAALPASSVREGGGSLRALALTSPREEGGGSLSGSLKTEVAA